MQKIISFSKAILNHAKNRFSNVSDLKQQERIAICNKCDQINLSNNTCNSCGCFLNIKTQWASEKCPLDKWGVEESNAAIDIDPRLTFSMNPSDPSEHTSFILPSGDCNCSKKNV